MGSDPQEHLNYLYRHEGRVLELQELLRHALEAINICHYEGYTTTVARIQTLIELELAKKD